MAKNSGSDTESGEECETAQLKNSCLQFNMFMQNIPLVDRELSHVCASVCAFFRHLTGNGVGHHTICIEQTKRPTSPDHVYGEDHRAQSVRAALKG